LSIGQLSLVGELSKQPHSNIDHMPLGMLSEATGQASCLYPHAGGTRPVRSGHSFSAV